jgi:hypothetical protein
MPFYQGLKSGMIAGLDISLPQVGIGEVSSSVVLQDVAQLTGELIDMHCHYR